MTDRIKWSGPFTGLDGVIRAAQAEKEGLIVEVTYGRDQRTRRDPVSGFHKEFYYFIGKEVNPREAWVNVYDGESHTWFTKEEADGNAYADRLECIHMREVIE